MMISSPASHSGTMAFNSILPLICAGVHFDLQRTVILSAVDEAHNAESSENRLDTWEARVGFAHQRNCVIDFVSVGALAPSARYQRAAHAASPASMR